MADNNNRGITLFGFQIKRQDAEEKLPASPVTPQVEDGSLNIQTGGSFGIYVDMDGTYRTEVDLLTKYRTMAMQPEMENAIDDIINEAIVVAGDGEIVKIDLDELEGVSDSIKNTIRDEFQEILKLLNFNKFGTDTFRRWYVDGKVYYNVVIDEADPRAGIKQLIYIDPRRIRKIRNVIKEKNNQGVEVIVKIDTFYIYNEKVVNNNVQSPQIIGNFAGGVKLSEDSVVLVTSGLFDPAKSTVLSYLHKAIRPMNQLRFVEDATVIYRVSRAPERRVFYVDVGNMPKMKAEQYLKDIMTKFRNKLTYDAATGEVRDQTKHLSMLEDFWMPRRGEGKNTEITTLPAGQNLGQMEDVLYFEKKLYRALGVPVSRLEPQQGFQLGRASEITRDEIKFDKFIDRMRARFSVLFDELMSRQLTLKGVCTLDEWNEFKESIRYDFTKDNNFTELKEIELITNRATTLGLLDVYVGRYFSKRWVQENILRFDEEEIEKLEEEMEKENDEMMKQAQEMADAGLNPDGTPADAAGGAAGGADGTAQPSSPAEGGPQPTSDPKELNDRVKKQLNP